MWNTKYYQYQYDIILDPSYPVLNIISMHVIMALFIKYWLKSIRVVNIGKNENMIGVAEDTSINDNITFKQMKSKVR